MVNIPPIKMVGWGVVYGCTMFYPRSKLFTATPCFCETQSSGPTTRGLPGGYASEHMGVHHGYNVYAWSYTHDKSIFRDGVS